MITDRNDDEFIKQLEVIGDRLQSKELTPEQADAEVSQLMATQEQAMVRRVEAALEERRIGQRRRAMMVFVVIVAVLLATGAFSRIFQS